MKVIFMGTPEFSVGTLEAIHQAGHEIVLCVTQPDKKKGRGEKLCYPPVKEKALELGIPVFQPDKIRKPEHIAELKKYQADVSVVIAFGQILPKEILEMTPYGCVNVHASLLPKYRGAAPIQWAILNGEKTSGVTTMQMDEGLDTGDMLLEEEIVLAKKETAGSLHDKLSKVGASLLVKTLEELEKGTITPRKQGESPTEYAKMINKEMGKIDWHKDAHSIERLIRGMNPWPSAYTKLGNKVFKIWDADVLEEDSTASPGTITKVKKDAIVVATKKGQLE
ncbi:MAG TPA: methionyl-tRNA formyltransferase, partial [Candidatus Dorea intestinavium]|nr:methionyl-tRNA formyltransferase [Candidatus Dorea intestinavium]